MKVRIVGVGGVGGCMLCASVSEYRRDNGEGADLQDLARMSYKRRYVSLETESVVDWEMLR